jgi:predicted ATPase
LVKKLSEKMNNYIASANLNVQNGLLQGTIAFTRGLNIISGENGTLKTQLLHALKSGMAVQAVAGVPLRTQAISPKRNSERRTSDQIVQLVRAENKSIETNLSERVNAQLNLFGFANYPSAGEIYFQTFNHRCKDGGDQKTHMSQVAAEFNAVIGSVFPRYRLVEKWNEISGTPQIQICKNANNEFPIEALSMGEQEVLSLVLNLSTSKDGVDTYLIDEPEVHLNWHLEAQLFEFLESLCEVHGKQVIVVTHSRVIFKPKFYSKAQFLSWGEDQKIHISSVLSLAQRQHLAGDAVEIIALGTFGKPTFFVEDEAHSRIITGIAKYGGTGITVSKCGDAANVKSLFKYQKAIDSPWANAFFVVDGDANGNQFPNESAFIHLPYYCLENMLLDPATLSTVSNRSHEEVQRVICAAVLKSKAEIFKKNKFFEFLISHLLPEHMTFERLCSLDASMIVSDVFDDLGLGSYESALQEYLKAAESAGRLDQLVPKSMLSVLIQKT